MPTTLEEMTETVLGEWRSVFEADPDSFARLFDEALRAKFGEFVFEKLLHAAQQQDLFNRVVAVTIAKWIEQVTDGVDLPQTIRKRSEEIARKLKYVTVRSVDAMIRSVNREISAAKRFIEQYERT